MKINRNMSAVLTNNQLKRTENKLSKSMERLSSGFKINSAGDNPAGMAISKKMKAQIDGLSQANDNADNGISTLRIADGALNEVSSMLQRIRELSVQAANGTNSADDRASIQQEIGELVKEVDRISGSTEYNTKPLLDGTSDVRIYGNDFTRMRVSDSVITGEYAVTLTEKAEKAWAEITYDPSSNASGYISFNRGKVSDDPDKKAAFSEATIEIFAGMDEDTFLDQLRTVAAEADCEVEKTAGNTYRVVSRDYGSAEQLQVSVSDSLSGIITGSTPDSPPDYHDDDGGVQVYEIYGKDAKITLEEEDFSETAAVTANGNRVRITDRDGFSIDFLLNENADAGTKIDIEVTDIGPMTLQIGANQYQTMDVRIPEISSESLYLDRVNVCSEAGATKALETLDDAISRLSEIRSRIGAFTNRLEYASNSLAESEEDMTNAYSSLLDTDMAEEMTEFTRQNVLDQAAVSVLAQANELPDKILSLLS